MQLLKPSTIEAIGLRAPRDLCDVARMAKGSCKTSCLQDLPQGHPVHSGRFPHDGGNPASGEPIREPMHGAGKGAQFLDRLGGTIRRDTPPGLCGPDSDARSIRMDERQVLQHGLGLLAFFGHGVLPSGCVRSAAGQTKGHPGKDTSLGRAVQRGETVSS